jgi:hypothetical protein
MVVGVDCLLSTSKFGRWDSQRGHEYRFVLYTIVGY